MGKNTEKNAIQESGHECVSLKCKAANCKQGYLGTAAHMSPRLCIYLLCVLLLVLLSKRENAHNLGSSLCWTSMPSRWGGGGSFFVLSCTAYFIDMYRNFFLCLCLVSLSQMNGSFHLCRVGLALQEKMTVKTSNLQTLL